VRTLAIAAILAALAAPAFAQDMAGSNKHHGAPKKSADEAKAKVDDKDYKAALDRLPQQKHDPWGTVRSSGGSSDKH
jgi:Tfp pilus assembly protein FimT